MRKRAREHLLKQGEVVTAAELFKRLKQRTAQLNNREFAADFNTLRKVAEAANDVSAARLDLEQAAQLVWLSEHGVKHSHPVGRRSRS